MKIIYKNKDIADFVPIYELYCSKIGLLDNFKLIFLELIFSKQIINILRDTASAPLSQPEVKSGSRSYANSQSWKGDNGLVSDIAKFLPGTLMTKLFQNALIDMIYWKFYICYGLLVLSNEHDESEIKSQDDTIDISDFKFRVNKDKLDQLTPYTGKLEAIWIGLEVFFASVSYLCTNSLEVTLLITASLEFIKRFKI